MPRIAYKEIRFNRSSKEIIEKANAIIAEYLGGGYELTLRQLYYQFVARNFIRNTMKEYKRLGAIINDARLAGLLDWDHIVDRTRSVRGNSHWDSPSEIVDSCAAQFRYDLWEDQKFRPEVWIEKDALVGVIEKVCRENDIHFLSCRGYTSQSEMWGSAMRLRRIQENDQVPVIIHLGDHDPSGKDMTEDIIRRMDLFMGGLDVKRIALNLDQIRKYNPPPNPAKLTDTRAAAYIDEFGKDSWELDALEPQVIGGLVEKTILKMRDDKKWKAAVKRQEAAREELREVARNM